MKMSEHEARSRLAELVAGKQPAAMDAINDVLEDTCQKPFDDLTVKELLDFIVDSADPLNAFWR